MRDLQGLGVGIVRFYADPTGSTSVRVDHSARVEMSDVRGADVTAGRRREEAVHTERMELEPDGGSRESARGEGTIASSTHRAGMPSSPASWDVFFFFKQKTAYEITR